MVSKQGLVAIAAAEVGQHEVGGNNLGPAVDKYRAASNIGPGPWPWCAEFCCWVLAQWLATDDGRRYCTDNEIHAPEKWRSRHADAFGWQTWGAEHGLLILPSSAQAQAGDFAIFTFSHIGIVEHNQIQREPIRTIEGNTNVAGARDSTDGDGVLRKSRGAGVVKCYIRL